MTRLLVLWLLAERPRYGYEITKGLSDSGMRFWFAVEEASIYSVLRTLTRNGHAVEQAVERADTGRPRVRYALTPAGRDHYTDLLRTALSQAAGGDLDEVEVDELLDRRAGALTELRDQLEGQARSAPAAGIVDRRRALLDAELAWLRARKQ
jgi:DNA-binding PadR family transcriptional regulator